jgi:hypothetical protein
LLLLQCLEAFFVAFLVTFLELVTSKYPRTLCLVSKCPSLYLYAGIYGAFGGITNLLYPRIAGGAPPAVGAAAIALGDPWVRAALIGLMIKAFLHVRIFEVATGPGKSVPVGIETITQLFEPWLLKNIGLEHWIALSGFLTPAAAKYAGLEQTRAQALAAIPATFDASERAAMTDDLKAATRVFDLLQIYLNNVGCRVFKNTFP